MQTRAAAAELTRDRILDAALDLFLERHYDDVSMREIAATAGVAPQTVVNHFATKEAVFVAAAFERFQGQTEELRYRAAAGDIAAAVDALAADYERTAGANARLLAVEDRVPAVHEVLAEGRAVHRRWVERTFPNALAGLRGTARKRRLAQLASVTDASTWLLLRRDHGLAEAEAADAVRELIESIHRKPKGSSQ